MKRVFLGTCVQVCLVAAVGLAQPASQRGVPAPEQQRPVREVVLQGCLVAGGVVHEGARTADEARSDTSAAGTDDVYLLHHATRGDVADSGGTEGGSSSTQGRSTPPAQGERSVQGTTPGGQQSAYQQATQSPPDASVNADATRDATYRLIATGNGVNLRPHVGHRIEVRGRVADVSGAGWDVAAPDAGEASQRGPGASGAQHGQSGQRTTTPANTQAGQRVGNEDVGSDGRVSAVRVTSVRMIATSCEAAQ